MHLYRLLPNIIFLRCKSHAAEPEKPINSALVAATLESVLPITLLNINSSTTELLSLKTMDTANEILSTPCDLQTITALCRPTFVKTYIAHRSNTDGILILINSLLRNI